MIRFWEREFHQIRPKKTTTNQRRYTRSGVLRIALVKFLLHSQGNSLAKAKDLLRNVDMSDGGVEHQLSLLMGDKGSVDSSRRKPGLASAGEVDGEMRKDTNGSFLQERDKLHSELKEIRAQCRKLISENKALVERMDRHEEALAKMQEIGAGGMKKILQLLDEYRREG